MGNDKTFSSEFSKDNGFCCLYCGKPLGGGTKFCTGCGKPVTDFHKTEKVNDEVKPSENNVCPNCGKSIKPNAKFCGSCGFSFIKKEENTVTPPVGAVNESEPQNENEPVEEKILCPKCGVENKSGMLFCVVCGHKLDKPVAHNIDVKYVDVYNEEVKLCQNCGAQLKPGLRFCSSCGKPADDNLSQKEFFNPVPPEGYNPQKQETELREDSVEDDKEYKKKSSKAPLAIGIIIVSAILIAAAVLVWAFRDKLFVPEEVPLNVETVLKNIEENSKKTVVSYKLDDFNGDGKLEAFVLVGTSDKKTGEINNADLWYTDNDETKEIVQDFTGHSNGIINSTISKYFTIEVLDADENKEENITETGAEEARLSHTYIYGVVNESCYEADISGKYVNVHQDGDAIVCLDDKGNSMEIKEGEENWSVIQTGSPEEPDKGEALTETQVEQFETMFTSLIMNVKDDYPDGFNSLKLNDAYKSVIGAYCNVYYSYFDDEIYSIYDHEGAVKDPRNKLCDPNGKPDDTNWYAYVRRNADNAEWILENILNVKPDRNKYNEGALNSNGFEYYLEDGYYYTETGKYSDEAAVYELKNYEFIGDNKYNLILEDSKGTAPKYTAVSELKEIDGNKYLTLISVKVNK